MDPSLIFFFLDCNNATQMQHAEGGQPSSSIYTISSLIFTLAKHSFPQPPLFFRSILVTMPSYKYPRHKNKFHFQKTQIRLQQMFLSEYY